MHPDDVILLPQPRSVEWGESTMRVRSDDRISLHGADLPDLRQTAEGLREEIAQECGVKLHVVADERGPARDAIRFVRDADRPAEGYAIDGTADGFTIRYADLAGAFYATQTLSQLFGQCGRSVPAVSITDHPTFRHRGLLVDISRNKIPTLATLQRIVDLMAAIKLNHLQLYIQGFPFAYPSYPDVWQDGSPLQPWELLRLDQYCRDRHVELVPCQNSFGHMSDWLTRDAFNDLAECPDGYERNGERHAPTTLDPTNPESLSFLETTYDDLLPYFTSTWFNVCCDETWELGEGRSRAACEEYGRGHVYLDFLRDVHELVTDRGKRMLFWADMINKHPEIVPSVPEDAVVLEWGYDPGHPFAERGARYADLDLPFFVCPGTGTWNSIAGDTDRMGDNIAEAAAAGAEHDALGMLITDWGDNGHWQPRSVSYPGYVRGGAMSWCVESNSDPPVAAYLDRFVFADRHEVMGDLLLDLGRYSRHEEDTIPNRTVTFQLLQTGVASDRLPADISIKSLRAVEAHAADALETLERAALQSDSAEQITSEIRTAARLVRHGARLGQLRHPEVTPERRTELLAANAAEIGPLIRSLRETWLGRNAYGALDDSLAPLRDLETAYGNLAG